MITLGADEVETAGDARQPSPATYAFSLSAWRKAHPDGNVKAAIAKAKNSGYTIIGNDQPGVADTGQRPSPNSEPMLGPIRYARNPQGQRVAVRQNPDGTFSDALTGKLISDSEATSQPSTGRSMPLKPGYIRVQLPGQPPGQIPAAQRSVFLVKNKGARILQDEPTAQA